MRRSTCFLAAMDEFFPLSYIVGQKKSVSHVITIKRLSALTDCHYE